MAWLLVFGLLHAYLLWDGDILRLYAICGAAVFPALRLRTRTLFTLAVAVFAVGSVLGVVAGETLKTAPAPVVREWSEFWQPSASQVAKEVDVFRSGWLTQLPTRAHRAFEFDSFDMWLQDVWRVSGLMLAGVGLFRLGVLTGHRSRSVYLRLALIGFGVGLPVVWFGFRQNQASRWAFVDAYFIGSQWNYWGSVAVALGWIGLILFIWRAGIAPSLRRRLAAVGRMAFSSYIAETLLCTLIFYGTGLGLFGRVSRAGQLAIVAVIWLLLLVAAPLWLARFRIGPLEWLWRRLTYGRSQRNLSRVSLSA
jgi:uncharacterized protein